MEDWTTILIVAIGILFSIFKAKYKDTDESDFEEEKTFEEKPVVVKPSKPTTKKAPRPFIQQDAYQKSNERKTSPIPPPMEQPTISTIEENNEDFQINSAEEARKAIIWGEILQRKHF